MVKSLGSRVFSEGNGLRVFGFRGPLNIWDSFFRMIRSGGQAAGHLTRFIRLGGSRLLRSRLRVWKMRISTVPKKASGVRAGGLNN